jgi:hypothetical protein
VPCVPPCVDRVLTPHFHTRREGRNLRKNCCRDDDSERAKCELNLHESTCPVTRPCPETRGWNCGTCRAQRSSFKACLPQKKKQFFPSALFPSRFLIYAKESSLGRSKVAVFLLCCTSNHRWARPSCAMACHPGMYIAHACIHSAGRGIKITDFCHAVYQMRQSITILIVGW